MAAASFVTAAGVAALTCQVYQDRETELLAESVTAGGPCSGRLTWRRPDDVMT